MTDREYWESLTEDKLRKMNKGELVRASWGVGIGYRQMNEPDDCVWLVQTISGKKTDSGWYDVTGLARQEILHTFKEALDSIDLIDLLWCGESDSFKIKNATDDSWDGMDNDDVHTYIVTNDKDGLEYAIHCVFIGDREWLISDILERRKRYVRPNK